MRGILFAAVTVFALAGCGGGSEPQSAGSSASASSASRTMRSFETPTTTSASDALSAWKQEVGPSMRELGDAFNAVGDSAKAGDYAEVRSGCRQLDEASKAVASHLPAPDIGLNATLEEMTGNASAAARLCMGFDEDTPLSVISEATGLITKANGQIETATRIINGLG